MRQNIILVMRVSQHKLNETYTGCSREQTVHKHVRIKRVHH